MKTLLLSQDDIQNFSKLIYDPKAAQIAADTSQAASCNLMALQYYLKHPNNYPPAIQAPVNTSHSQQQVSLQHHIHQQQQQQQLLAQSQSQLKQLQLKQPTIHQQQSNYLQHHPYYQSPVPPVPPTNTIVHTPVPAHALNQNSNFSANSSSTGGGGSSSNAPTHQSSNTGSSLSPKSGTGGAYSNSTGAGSAANVRTSISSGTKKLKTEPVLSQFHQTERYTFANAHLIWSEDNWKRVVFQDERKFNLDGPDGFSYYFHDLRNYERTLSQRPRGNSVYIYFVITSGGPIHIEVSTTKLKTETCIEMILRERSNIVTKLGGGKVDFVLQDHNWSVNALPTAQNWLSAEGIKTQKWPTISHDLNIMESIWGWLIREVYDGGRKFSRKDDLIFRIREAWTRLPMDLVNNLYSTLPERITELYYTRGVYTNC